MYSKIFYNISNIVNDPDLIIQLLEEDNDSDSASLFGDNSDLDLDYIGDESDHSDQFSANEEEEVNTNHGAEDQENDHNVEQRQRNVIVLKGSSEDPEFVEQIENITVPAGRNVKLACTVKNLGTFKVAWMHFEQSAILTVHSHVITRNPRISVTHDKHRTWFLHISNVQEEDRGRYMCQINTVTAKTQFGYLHVVVPPNIDDSLSSSDVIVREAANVTLTCHASGSPTPSIKWKRDDGSKISINKSFSVSEWEGEVLEMTRISRLDMGAYLCIASNSVPPTVSKRIKVSVDFPPMLWIPHQLVGAPLGYNVTLECHTEAHPTSLNYWTRDDGHMIHDNLKYHTQSRVGSPSYKTHMQLTIYKTEESDYGTYKCVAKNPRGETDGTIRLYTSAPPSTSPAPTTSELPQTLDPQLEEKSDNSIPSHKNSHREEKGRKGTKYTSNLNEIDKSEQKFQDSEPRGTHYEWPEEKSNNGSCRQGYFLDTHVIMLLIMIGSFSHLCRR